MIGSIGSVTHGDVYTRKDLIESLSSIIDLLNDDVIFTCLNNLFLDREVEEEEEEDCSKNQDRCSDDDQKSKGEETLSRG